jgi:hypothetical protein
MEEMGEKETSTQLGPLERANLNHWTQYRMMEKFLEPSTSVCFTSLPIIKSRRMRFAYRPLLIGFLLGSLFYSEQGGDMFLRNIGLLPNYTVTNRRP